MPDLTTPPVMPNQTNVPVPDPTTLTTDQLRREIAALRELIEARLDAMDQASDLRQDIIAGIPREINAQIAHLRGLHGEKFDSMKDLVNEKFTGIDKQFLERDVRTAQASSAADDALKAALQAAKELVGSQGEATAAAAVKSETSFTKQIDQIGTIIQTLEKALDSRITELKERIDRGEGVDRGSADSRASARLDIGQVLTALIVIASLVGLVLTVVLRP